MSKKIGHKIFFIHTRSGKLFTRALSATDVTNNSDKHFRKIPYLNRKKIDFRKAAATELVFLQHIWAIGWSGPMAHALILYEAL